MNLKDIGIVLGTTVTPSLIEKAKAAGLPDAALIELWPKRTINKKALAAIVAAVEAETPTAEAEEKESE